MELRQKEAQDALERDIKLVNEFMRAEKAEKESNFRKRLELREEMQMYQENLAKAKEIEQQRHIHIENHYKQEMERV